MLLGEITVASLELKRPVSLRSNDEDLCLVSLGHALSEVCKLLFSNLTFQEWLSK